MNYLANRRNIILVVLSALVVATVAWSIVTLKHAKGRAGLSTRRLHGRAVRATGPIGVEAIGSWMTFDYINFAFHLPKTYLQNALSISDRQYPNLEIGQYAKRQTIDTQSLIKDIQRAVEQYRKF